MVVQLRRFQQFALGQPVSYKLMPGENILPFAHPDASIIKRAGFMTKHLWVTPYHRDEISATGPVPQPAPGRRRAARVHEK